MEDLVAWPKSGGIELSFCAARIRPRSFSPLSQNAGSTDVHIRWYAAEATDEQPTPAHLDTDIWLEGKLIAGLTPNVDYHVA